MDPSAALVLRFAPDATQAFRDQLVALLSDYGLVAIQEDDIHEPSVWTAHFANATARDAASARIAADQEFAAIQQQSVEVEDEDWARRTQADLPAVTIGRVTVAPPWDLPVFAESPSGKPHPDVLVIIEPSRGFGTGHHQSTRLCIVLLQGRDLKGQTVIDVGTGSGVLAITAAKLGASFVAAFDTDPDALENARENIVANDVQNIIDAHVEDLTTTRRPPADVVIANLTGTLLSHHAADLARLVRQGGSLIVSGFNIDERDRVTDALTPLFAITEAAEEDDWHAFVLTRAS